MDISFWHMLYVFVLSIGGSIIQTSTGFGFGLFVMMFFPLFVTVAEAGALSGSVAFLLTVLLVWKTRSHLQIKKLIVPLIVTLVFDFIFSYIAGFIDLTAFRVYLGIFFILISLYLYFFSGKFSIQANTGTAFLCGSLSGIINGLFGVGGPPILPYFLAAFPDDQLAYLANLQFLFMASGVTSLVARIMNGVFTWRILLLTLPGVVGMFLGQQIGMKIIHKVKAQTLKTAIYIALFLAGVLTIVKNL